MITDALLARFLKDLSGQPWQEGTRYAREGRVAPFSAPGNLATTTVQGVDRFYDVALWSESGVLTHRCACPSWRDPCKHIVAAAIDLRRALAPKKSPPNDQTKGAAPAEQALAALAASASRDVDPEEMRSDALEERVLSARTEAALVSFAGGPRLVIKGPSDYPSTVTVRGGPAGPHGCTCPDFEANRLHTCKHVERVRTFLKRRRKPLPRGFGPATRKARIYLHFGEMVEPRLLGKPRGRGAPAVRAAFDAEGLPLQAMDPDPDSLLQSLSRFGAQVETEALAWLAAKAGGVPRYRNGARLRLSHLKRRGLAPYPYQQEGALFLARRGRALLADEMGLGKTIQAILAALSMRQAILPLETVTVVCPASLRGGWAAEIKRWAGEEAELLFGTARARAQQIRAKPRWLITHYEQVLRDSPVHAAAPPDLLILDEAQRAKGLLAKTARALKAIPSRHLFALTGTPLENRLEEAYAIAQLIDQRLLPPLWQIDRDHFVRDPEQPRRVLLYRDLKTLRSTLAPAFLRRRKEDVLPDLPERVQTISRLPMHPAVVDTYEEVITQVAKILRRKVLRPGDVQRMQRLFVIARRCCNGPHMLGDEVPDEQVPKLRELREALRELCLGEGRKVVVFSEWTDMTDRVEELSRKLKIPTFHLKGSVPIKRRPAMIQAFSETKGPAVFVSTDAGGVGLNLQAADAVVNLDLPWNPARLDQRIARVHRIGTTETVRVILLVTENSLEERILSLHDTKRDVFENIWAKNGSDFIAAPGGSGALREMLRTLLADALEEQEGPEEEAAAGQPPSRSLVEEPGPLPERQADAGQSLVLSPPAQQRHPPEEPSPRAPAAMVDPAVLAQAVASLAPTLPLEHRQSLATVFRALADALGEGDAPRERGAPRARP